MHHRLTASHQLVTGLAQGQDGPGAGVGRGRDWPRIGPGNRGRNGPEGGVVTGRGSLASSCRLTVAAARTAGPSSERA